MTTHSREWLWHTLALVLGGRTVAEWKRAMGRDEFDAWAEYYAAQPFDDLHRYHRPAALVAASHGAKLDAALDWLQPKKSDGRTQADRDLFEAAGAIPPPRTPQ